MILIEKNKEIAKQKKIIKFIEQMNLNANVIAKEYLKITGDNIWGYGEEEVRSILAKVFSEISDCFLLEQKIKVKKKTRSVDFWIKYKDIDILIEVKVVKDKRKDKTKTKKKIFTTWEKGIEQIKDIKKKDTDLKEIIYNNKVFRVLIQYNTISQFSEKNAFSNYSKDDLKIYTQDIISGFTQEKPDYIWMNYFDKRLQKEERYSDGYQKNFGYILFVKVEEVK
jgi:hypothetical protein